jgi:hypothetical protein
MMSSFVKIGEDGIRADHCARRMIYILRRADPSSRYARVLIASDEATPSGPYDGSSLACQNDALGHPTHYGG